METNGNTKIVDFKTHLRRVTIYAVKHALSRIFQQTIKKMETNGNTKIVDYKYVKFLTPLNI